MNKINSIQINHFKFFRSQPPIRLGGNNLLLYGENGSGKSSIYWALYTLFEASIKGSDDEIRKYFTKTIKADDSLVNIHAAELAAGSDDYGSFIEIITDDTTPVSYKASKADVAIRGNPSAQYVNYASDFINYRMLLGFSAFRHSDKIDLFEVFVESVLKYVQFSKVDITRSGTKLSFTNGYDIWKQIEQGPEWVNSKHSKKPRRILAYKGSPEWIEFNSLVQSFNDSLQKLIDYINIHGPAYFSRLGYSFPYTLEYTPAGFIKKEKNYDEVPFKVSVIIPQYEAVINSVLKPQSFLNEAKLSGIAISIRFAILSQKLKENCLKFIVLDDLLISLDMRNREKVLNILLSPEFYDNFQLIFFSHDRMFYQMAKHKIKERSQANWVYYEMYEKRVAGKSEPLILEEIGYLGKAFQFLESNELEIAANFLRKEAEAFCKEILPKKQSLKADGTYKDLSALITEAVNFARLNALTPDVFNSLDKHRKFVLNPGSHDSYDVPKYKNEIEDCYQNLLEIRKWQIKLILPKKAKLIFELKVATDTYRFEIEMAEEGILLKEPGKPSIIPRTHLNYDVLKNGTKTQPDTQHKVDSLGAMYSKMYQQSDKTKSASEWDEMDVTIDGVTQKLILLRTF